MGNTNPLGRYSSKAAAKAGIYNDLTRLQLSTHTDKGLNLAANGCFGGAGDRPDKNNLAIVLTDGRSSNDLTAAAANLRGVADVRAVGVDLAVESELLTICGGDPSCYRKVAKFTDLPPEVGSLAQSTCGEHFNAVVNGNLYSLFICSR